MDSGQIPPYVRPSGPGGVLFERVVKGLVSCHLNDGPGQTKEGKRLRSRTQEGSAVSETCLVPLH